MNRERMLDRFLRYVQIETTANEAADQYPSSSGQWELGRLLVDELHEIGLNDAEQDEHGLVWATIPPTVKHATPVVALNSHLDTSPETTAANVRPNVIREYAGGDIPLPGDSSQVIRVADNPELKELHGCTLVTTDGTTLLGGDDKAGLAIIVETAAHLMEHPELPHGPVRLLFTCDEEIGRGVKHVDLKRLGADVCYTLDGGGADEIDVETFNAIGAVLTVVGKNIHPSIAKGRMINAIRLIAEVLEKLPKDTLTPETTDGRDGFLHPYQISGSVAEASARLILRDFDMQQLEQHADRLGQAAQEVARKYPGSNVAVEFTQQYRNMADGLKKDPRAVQFAKRAHEQLGREAKLTVIRGGTDGSQLTAMGLPTPNLSSGQHNPHSPLEWICLDEMERAVELVIELLAIWAERPSL